MLSPELRRGALGKAELVGSRLPAFVGRAPPALRTRHHSADGRPVYLLHNPKAAGTSLKSLLGVTQPRSLHIGAQDAFSRKAWREGCIVVAIRHPVARFLSGYRFHVAGPYKGALFRRHGAALKALSPLAYLEFIQQYPEYLGPQTRWALYPDTAKPRADIVLRVEDAPQWPAQLREAGIEIDDDRLAHQNRSGASDQECLTDEVIDAVASVYAEDFEAFGYRISGDINA